MKKILTLVVAMLTLTTFANAEEAETSERDKIKARTAELTSTWNSGDYEGYLAIYDEGFMSIAYGAAPLTDREQFRKDLADEIGDYTPIKYMTKSLKIHGNYAYELGMDSYDFEGDNGETVTGNDDYLVIWNKNKEGVWSIMADVYWESITDEEITESVTKEINARKAEFVEYWDTGNAEGALSVYDKDIIMIADRSKPLVDRKAWAKTLAEEVEVISDFGLNATSLKVQDGFAFEVGTFTYTMEEAGTGEYVFVWKKDDKGAWHIYVEVWWDPASDDDKKEDE